ncbi:hypothetical protein EVAR_13153_1 [Eumeta japonica]|uniref:Uncharacterized protein n=1 Tax=Eumeta variegata TaxID=151549 RepID=A0A4C1U9S1_EUMVA|nr:hypothetical protein EVAR_13153_1 [Eumeta japonica]
MLRISQYRKVVRSSMTRDLYPGDGHNWRSIIFSLMVISFVIAGIVTAIYLLGGIQAYYFATNSWKAISFHRYVDELLYWSGRRMRLEEFLRGELTAERLPTTWVGTHQLVYQADDGGLLAFDTINNTLSVLVTNHTLVSHSTKFLPNLVSHVLTLSFDVRPTCNTLISQ